MAIDGKPMSLARQIVNFAIQAGSSDIHLEEGSPIAIRVNSDIRILENILGPNDMSRLLSEIVGDEKLDQFNLTGDLDTSIGLEGLSRIRINAYKANEKRCLTLRILPDNLPNWQDLGLPQPSLISPKSIGVWSFVQDQQDLENRQLLHHLSIAF